MSKTDSLLAIATRAARQADRLEEALDRHPSSRTSDLRVAYSRAVAIEASATAALVRELNRQDS